MATMTRKKALDLLRSARVPDNVIKHSEKVSEVALEIGRKLKAKGEKVDLNFLECGALLHDIGRSKSHGVLHGIEGAKILRKYPKYARVCKVHS
jgi:uncharacterized protein